MSEKGVRLEYEVHFRRDRRARKVARKGPSLAPTPDSVPRIARLLALAHKWEGTVRRGEVKDYAEIAESCGLTQARVAQICNLTLLSSDIQNSLLGSSPNPFHIHLRSLRQMATKLLWRAQEVLPRDAHPYPRIRCSSSRSPSPSARG